MRECWVIEEQHDNGDWYVIFCGGKITVDEELARWPSTPENPKRVVRYVPDTTAPPQEDRELSIWLRPTEAPHTPQEAK